MTQLTASATLALQLEMIKQQLPKMFPTKKVTARAHYRYSWEKTWRVLPLKTYTVSDSLYERFMDVSDKSLVQEQIERILKRYHWTDRAGRVRRVKDVHVFVENNNGSTT